MVGRKGFNLIEIIVAVTIIGILTAIAIPSYVAYVQQGAANAAQNSLLTIYGAQKNYYYKTGSYCINACAGNLAGINSNLSLNINDNYYNYACVAATLPNRFCCTATNISNGNVLSTCG